MAIVSRNIDTFGIASLSFFSLMLGFNQVVMKVVNTGIQPIFCAGLRSLFAAIIVFIWLALCKKKILFERDLLLSTICYGLIFGGEFLKKRSKMGVGVPKSGSENHFRVYEIGLSKP